jgi:hypothetical protein
MGSGLCCLSKKAASKQTNEPSEKAGTDNLQTKITKSRAQVAQLGFQTAKIYKKDPELVSPSLSRIVQCEKRKHENGHYQEINGDYDASEAGRPNKNMTLGLITEKVDALMQTDLEPYISFIQHN